MIPGENGKFTLLCAVNPQTVCCPEALLATGLFTLGVPAHPRAPFTIEQEEINGALVTRWLWVFHAQTLDGKYRTGDLIKWWKDDAWLRAHPEHEWTIIRTALVNMGEVARRVRETQARTIVRQGNLAAHIPAGASPARRQHLIDQLEGRIPVGTKFIDPIAEEQAA